ncbi:bifunctional Inorganic pyrophosphatase/Inorganic pyrophosphatase superfamily [Babesia duncani]|uniref:inorganic diphosphatase n=1 Tax=Babesia duncani TaxID=323732 RepID=A0AAD9PI51_9APIC|nr:bifunctional Inorganic pyrophosphatase/Inorganic pyrophosphatase superfamily [Babesia duncani]
MEVKTDTKGVLGTPEFEMYFKNEKGDVISPWHHIPLSTEPGLYNMVVEIPRHTTGKMEICTSKAGTPIKQDTLKDGSVRHLDCAFYWNYGAIPQTWECPQKVTIEDGKGNMNEYVGDNDPLDVIDIGHVTAEMGDVVPFKVVGALALVDQGEIDYKVFGIRKDDKFFDKINDLADIDIYYPGTTTGIREFFRWYKTPKGKPLNEFLPGKEFLNREQTLKVIEHNHKDYLDLKNGTIPPNVIAIQTLVKMCFYNIVDDVVCYYSRLTKKESSILEAKGFNSVAVARKLRCYLRDQFWCKLLSNCIHLNSDIIKECQYGRYTVERIKYECQKTPKMYYYDKMSKSIVLDFKVWQNAKIQNSRCHSNELFIKTSCNLQIQNMQHLQLKLEAAAFECLIAMYWEISGILIETNSLIDTKFQQSKHKIELLTLLLQIGDGPIPCIEKLTLGRFILVELNYPGIQQLDYKINMATLNSQWINRTQSKGWLMDDQSNGIETVSYIKSSYGQTKSKQFMSVLNKLYECKLDSIVKQDTSNGHNGTRNITEIPYPSWTFQYEMMQSQKSMMDVLELEEKFSLKLKLNRELCNLSKVECLGNAEMLEWMPRQLILDSTYSYDDMQCDLSTTTTFRTSDCNQFDNVNKWNFIKNAIDDCEGNTTSQFHIEVPTVSIMNIKCQYSLKRFQSFDSIWLEYICHDMSLCEKDIRENVVNSISICMNEFTFSPGGGNSSQVDENWVASIIACLRGIESHYFKSKAMVKFEARNILSGNIFAKVMTALLKLQGNAFPSSTFYKTLQEHQMDTCNVITIDSTGDWLIVNNLAAPWVDFDFASFFCLDATNMENMPMYPFIKESLDRLTQMAKYKRLIQCFIHFVKFYEKNPTYTRMIDSSLIAFVYGLEKILLDYEAFIDNYASCMYKRNDSTIVFGIVLDSGIDSWYKTLHGIYRIIFEAETITFGSFLFPKFHNLLERLLYLKPNQDSILQLLNTTMLPYMDGLEGIRLKTNLIGDNRRMIKAHHEIKAMVEESIEYYDFLKSNYPDASIQKRPFIKGHGFTRTIQHNVQIASLNIKKNYTLLNEHVMRVFKLHYQGKIFNTIKNIVLMKNVVFGLGVDAALRLYNVDTSKCQRCASFASPENCMMRLNNRLDDLTLTFRKKFDSITSITAYKGSRIQLQIHFGSNFFECKLFNLECAKVYNGIFNHLLSTRMIYNNTKEIWSLLFFKFKRKFAYTKNLQYLIRLAIEALGVFYNIHFYLQSNCKNIMLNKMQEKITENTGFSQFVSRYKALVMHLYNACVQGDEVQEQIDIMALCVFDTLEYIKYIEPMTIHKSDPVPEQNYKTFIKAKDKFILLVTAF